MVQGAAIIDPLGKGAGADVLVVQDLVAGLLAGGQPLRGGGQPQGIHLFLGDVDGGAAALQLIGDVGVADLVHDLDGVFGRQPAVQKDQTGLAGPVDQQRRAADAAQQQRQQRDALSQARLLPQGRHALHVLCHGPHATL
jgi:hypothetical protein